MDGMMRAAFYERNDAVRVDWMTIPAIGSHELLVEVHANGLCGTDVMEEYRLPKVRESLERTKRGLILGHEIAGKVIEAGEDVKQNVGRRVVVAHHVACGECQACKDGNESSCKLLRSTNIDPGGLAEYIRVPRENIEKGLYELPEQLSFEEGSVVEPLGCVVRGQRKADIRELDSVLILGSGIAGILHLKLAKARNAERKVYMTDVNEYRLKKAKAFGAGAVLNVDGLDDKRVREWLYDLNGRGTERVIVCTGNQSAANEAMECVEDGGKVLYFAGPQKGVNIPLSIDKWRGEIDIVQSYAASGKDMREALSLLDKGSVVVNDGFITHQLSLDEVQEGFELTCHPRSSLKVIIHSNSRLQTRQLDSSAISKV